MLRTNLRIVYNFWQGILELNDQTKLLLMFVDTVYAYGCLFMPADIHKIATFQYTLDIWCCKARLSVQKKLLDVILFYLKPEPIKISTLSSIIKHTLMPK